MIRAREFALSDRLLDWTATLPWWLDCIVAVLLFALLQALSQNTHSALEPATHEVLADLVLYGRYVVPGVFLIMAAASFWRRHQRMRLLQQAAVNPAADVLDQLSRREFELLVAEAFRLQGYEVDEMSGHAPDEGMDLVLWKDGHKSLVQCKPWKSYRVGVEVVRELTGIMHGVAADSAFLVTSGNFTRAARHFAAGRPLTLLDGQALRQWIAQVRSTPQTKQIKKAATTSPPSRSGLLAVRHGEVQPPLDEAALLALAQAREAVIPSCPQCGKPMQRQIARTDSPGVQSFWGCTAFPVCRGVRGLLQEPPD